MARFVSRRTTQTLLVLLCLFLIGTVGFLWAVRSYFSIDANAIIRSEELGTWDEIRAGAAEASFTWKGKYPWLAKALSLKPHESVTLDANAQSQFDDAIAKHAAEAAKAAGFGDDGVGFIPTGRNNTPTAWNPATDPPEKIPRIIHQTWKEATLPPQWQAVREECQRMHPDYEYHLWTDADSRTFLEQHYPWFLPTFDAYPYPIQRADAIRYFILHKYGGIYMDLDVGCLRRFDPLLRFEVVLPKTIPVGVSNDVMGSAKGHPFMDHLIHNLVTFNHQYLTHYPTVMFSTGPMFVSASYGLYVDSHGLAAPSTPANPSAGFKGIRVLPKSLYGKNAKPSEAPDAFFRHFYGSSWHAGDAGFLIFLREHGRLLIFVGFCVVLYGFARSIVSRFFQSVNTRSDRRPRNQSSRRGRWISLPFVRDPRSGQYRSLSQQEIFPKSRLDSATQTQNSPSPTTAAGAVEALGQVTRVAAPRPQRATMPLLDFADSDHSNGDEDVDLGPGLNAPGGGSIFSWMNPIGSRSQSSASNPMTADSAASPSWTRGRSGSTSKSKDKSGAGSILYLPAFLVGGSAASGSSNASYDSSFINGRGMDQDAQSPATGSGSWQLTQAHARNSSTSQGRSFANWASSFVSGNDGSNGAAGSAQSPSSLQKMWSGVNWGARTPSPSMFLGSTLGRLRMTDDREERDLESPPPRRTERLPSHQQEAIRMSKSNSGMSNSSILPRVASLYRDDVSENTSSVRRQGSDASTDVIVAVDDVPPPYDDNVTTGERRTGKSKEET